MNLSRIRNMLLNDLTLKDIIYLTEIDSTNKYAKENNVPGDILILADSQTEGRGRLDRKWESESGKNIAMSLVKYFNMPVSDMHIVNFYMSYVIVLALREITERDSINDFSLKWPNDILFKGKKICGILTETSDINKDSKKFIIGIGINVNQTNFSGEFRYPAVSLKNGFNKNFSLEDIIIACVKKFYGEIDLLNDKEKLFDLWKNNTLIIGKPVSVKTSADSEEIKAIVIDVESDGGIKVEIENGKKFKYFSGDVNVIF